MNHFTGRLFLEHHRQKGICLLAVWKKSLLIIWGEVDGIQNEGEKLHAHQEQPSTKEYKIGISDPVVILFNAVIPYYDIIIFCCRRRAR